MTDYYKLLSFGDIIETNIGVDPHILLNEIKDCEWSQYNPRKQNNRFGLSITSSDGSFNGIDLDSLYQYNEENDTTYKETSFKDKTEVYYKSPQIKKIVDVFGEHLCRSHLINLMTNGSFPPHRDWRRIDIQETFRIFIPIQRCNPFDMFFMYEDKPLYFNHGKAYFINTNKVHSLFSFSDYSIFAVMNIELNSNSLDIILDNMSAK